MAERSDVISTPLLLGFILSGFAIMKPCFRQPQKISITFGRYALRLNLHLKVYMVTLMSMLQHIL